MQRRTGRSSGDAMMPAENRLYTHSQFEFEYLHLPPITPAVRPLSCDWANYWYHQEWIRERERGGGAESHHWTGLDTVQSNGLETGRQFIQYVETQPRLSGRKSKSQREDRSSSYRRFSWSTQASHVSVHEMFARTRSWTSHTAPQVCHPSRDCRRAARTRRFMLPWEMSVLPACSLARAVWIAVGLSLQTYDLELRVN